MSCLEDSKRERNEHDDKNDVAAGVQASPICNGHYAKLQFGQCCRYASSVSKMEIDDGIADACVCVRWPCSVWRHIIRDTLFKTVPCILGPGHNAPVRT